MGTPHTTHTPDRETVYIVAARVGCDPRLARRIVEQGPTAARNVVQRERAERVCAELGLHIGAPA